MCRSIHLIAFGLIFFFILPVERSRADDSMDKHESSWRCYTGEDSDGNDWIFATDISDILPENLKFSIPNNQAFDRRFHWSPISVNDTAIVQQVSVVNGRAVYKVTYDDKKKSHCPSAVVYALGLDDKPTRVRPFFAYFFDQEAERGVGEVLKSDDKKAQTLHITIETNGQGMYWSDYTFSFEKRVPHFEGRTDGGRKLEETVTK